MCVHAHTETCLQLYCFTDRYLKPNQWFLMTCSSLSHYFFPLGLLKTYFGATILHWTLSG
uniref:Uncharacterized protein n=1 Tax=Rhizophora mucronata TaxID=61149 RepID=A0A2P2N7U4_RHIMU